MDGDCTRTLLTVILYLHLIFMNRNAIIEEIFFVITAMYSMMYSMFSIFYKKD